MAYDDRKEKDSPTPPCVTNLCQIGHYVELCSDMNPNNRTGFNVCYFIWIIKKNVVTLHAL